MGYFSNGTEGDIFHDKWCSRCVHCPTDDTDCPVLELHAIWNYDQNKKDAASEAKTLALDTLIRRETEKGYQECRMFVLREGALPPRIPYPPPREEEARWVREHPEAVLRYVQERRAFLARLKEQADEIAALWEDRGRWVDRNEELERQNTEMEEELAQSVS